MNRKYIWFSIFGLLFIILGLSREFFFVHLNNIMYLKRGGETVLAVPQILSGFNSLEYNTIYYLKYIFTFLSFLIFYLLSYFCLKVLTQNINLLKWLKYSYAILLMLSIFAMLWACFVTKNLQDDEYTFSRWLMGIAQSPLVALFFLASEKLANKLN